MKTLGRIFLFIAVVICVGCGRQSSTDEPPRPKVAINLADYTPEQLQEGQINFGVYCVACHGPAAQGLPGLGPNLTTSPFVQTHTDAELLAFIIVGRPTSDHANTSGVAMPARGGFPNLSDEDISTIIAYLRTLIA